MGKKPGSLLVIIFSIFALLGSCRALEDELAAGGGDSGSLFFVPDGYVVRFETGRGSYVPYQDKLEFGDTVIRPENPDYPLNGTFEFINWYQNSPYAKHIWNFNTQIAEEHFPYGKVLTLFARFNNPVKEKYIVENGIWGNNNLDDLMGQIMRLELGKKYTLSTTYWFQNSEQNRTAADANKAHGKLVVFSFRDQATGGYRVYDLEQRITSEVLWTKYEQQFTASKNDWYVVGITTGNTISGNSSRFFIKEISLKDEGGNELLEWNDFYFGKDTDEPFSCVTGGNGGRFLTINGPVPTLFEGIWYTGRTDWAAVTHEDEFLHRDAVLAKLAEQGGAELEETEYLISAARPANGNIVVAGNLSGKQTAGQTVTLTVTANSGYRVASVSVPGADDLQHTEGSAWTFTMPASDVAVTAVIEPET